METLFSRSFKVNPPHREVTSLITSPRTKMEVVTVTCILCNGTVNFKNRDPALFNAHMRDQHNTFYRIDYILASCFMQGQHLDKVEEEWAKMEREQRVEEVVEVDQDGEETNNGLNFEMLEEEEVGGGQDYNEVQEEVHLDQELVEQDHGADPVLALVVAPDLYSSS